MTVKFGEKWRDLRPPYVCGAKDPRKIPLDRCVSLGDLMATIERCKELDRLDAKKKRRK